MITRIEFGEAPLAAGAERAFRAWTDAEPLRLKIECFREPPRPPQLQPCQECGEYVLESGQEIRVRASSSVFRDAAGHILVTVTDAAGYSRQLTIAVS